jgi:flotillin
MQPQVVAVLVVVAILLIPAIVSRFLTSVEAGTIRLVSWFKGGTAFYKGPGKAIEVPLLTTGTTIPSRAINIDLDIADQTADIDATGQPKPIKVRVLASAIVSIGDTDELILTAANKFFSKTEGEQLSTLTDLLTSAGRRAINLLRHDELFSAKTYAAPTAGGVLVASDEDDDRLAIIIKKNCSRELHDLGLIFNSLNIKLVQSDVAEARRRQSAVEAQANADIVVAQQQRRAKEAQLAAEQAISDKNRDLEQTRAQNAALIAEAEAKKQDALALQRQAELKATQIAQAMADAERVRVEAQASADADAAKIRTVAEAQGEAIRMINQAISEGGNAYLTLRQLEMLPQIAPVIADALSQARMVTISNDDAAGETTSQITQVIQTVLAAQLVSGALGQQPAPPANGSGTNAEEIAALRPSAEQARRAADLTSIAPRRG